ncbi:MAG TPA: O-acetylhomoserine aminocarboxypropyltransferase [Dongiaceae bacterium]|nr:O-acetylhomoserine aminocarboxypropyltransferase [Dongiaceae bacterium]
MVEPRFLGPETLSLHAGQQVDPATGARAVPLYQTTSYVFDDSDHAAALFNLERPGHIYSRISNPTVAVFEERIASLDGGVGAVATASGHAALHLAIATLISSGGHIVASQALYGGSLNMLRLTMPRFGITTTFVPPRDIAAFRAAIKPETRLVFAETIGNPGLEVLDITAVAAVAHEAGIPLLIDSTFTPPVLLKPLDHGADIVLHSATKWLGGHGLAIGGVLIDGGRFDWRQNDKFPTMTAPYAGYHGISFADEFGPAAFVMRARLEGLRDFGACMSPANAFHILQGIETLPLRMERHVANARGVAAFLTENPAVAWVNYPGVPDSPDRALVDKLMPRGAGSMISFGVKGGRPAGRKFVDALKLASNLANVGDAKTLVIHPASTTHRQLDETALRAAGIGEDMIRLSVGLETLQDILDDLGAALRVSQKGA